MCRCRRSGIRMPRTRQAAREYLVKAFTGPLVDRIGPRAVSWTTDLASATAAAAVPLLHTMDLLSFPLLLVLVALIGAARGPGDLAKEVMVPGAAERGRVPLERATGLAGVIERLASTVGLAAGGTLVALLGPLTGLAVIVTVGITNLLDAAFTLVLVPVWDRESGNGPTSIGLLGGVMGAAAVSGFGAGFINPVLGAVLVERVPRRMLGRVNALGDSLAWAGIPLGGLLAGTAVTAVGLVPVLPHSKEDASQGSASVAT